MFTSIPFDPANFSCSGSMVWSVTTGALLRYVKRTDDATVWFEVDSGTISGTPDTDLIIHLPDDILPATDDNPLVGFCSSVFFYSQDNGLTYHASQAYVRQVNGKGVLQLTIDYEATNWAAGPVMVFGQITYPLG